MLLPLPSICKVRLQLAVADASWKVIETHRLTRAQFERWFHTREVALGRHGVVRFGAPLGALAQWSGCCRFRASACSRRPPWWRPFRAT